MNIMKMLYYDRIEVSQGMMLRKQANEMSAIFVTTSIF